MAKDDSNCAECNLGSSAIYGPTVTADAEALAKFRLGVCHIKAGQHVSRAGDVPNRVYAIREGWAFRYSLLSDGRRQILEFLLPGDMITIESICSDGQPSEFAVRALTDLTLCEFDLNQMKKLALGTEEQQAATCQLLRDHMTEMDRTMTNIGRRRAIGRLANLIITIHRKLLARGLASANEFECAIKREHLADALGLTSAHVNRTVAELERFGVLEIDQRRVRIVDGAALQRLAND